MSIETFTEFRRNQQVVGNRTQRMLCQVQVLKFESIPEWDLTLAFEMERERSEQSEVKKNSVFIHTLV